MHKLHILIADDDIITQKLLSHSFKEKGHKASVAIDGLEALKKLQRKHYFDVLLVDLLMPNMGGMKLLECVADLKRDSIVKNDLAIIVITAHPSADTREKAKEFGCMEYFTKPLDLNAIHTIIEKIASAN